MSDLQLAVEQYLASLDEDDWAALVVRVRPPMAAESSPHDRGMAYECRYSTT
ncbi:hypothetical protein [Mycobacterium sp. M23085]|uniref:hypothetical protein n=1 Tax=Mycobacterium sp. M23085 TaxID=3378087 RepID=UPI0038781F8A